MSRRSLVCVSLALAFAGSAVLPAVASAAGHDTPPVAACTEDTQAVQDLTAAVTTIGTALQATPADPTKLSQAAGDLFTSVTAAQDAGCLPALPTSTPTVPTPPAPTSAAPAGTHDVASCTADAVQLLSAALGVVSANIATTPDATAVTKAATDLVAAVTAINTDTCLPVTLPVPSVPALPAPPPVPPVS